MQQVLILNAGSSSLKWLVLETDSEIVRQEGAASWAGQEQGRHEREILAALARVTAVDAIGHRVVHGGARFQQAVLVDDGVRQAIRELAELAPLHNPVALAGIEATTARFPGVPQVAAFDTAFHASLPEAAAIYPLPWAWTERWGVRRFGFHGLSVQYALGRATEVLAAADQRNARARLATDIFVHRVASTIGAMATSLDGLDALVFTGGIGEHSPAIRDAVCA